MLHNGPKSLLDSISKIVTDSNKKYDDEYNVLEGRLQLEAMKKMKMEYVVPEEIEKEGVAHFMGAAAAAHKAGKKKFSFGGKVYPVQIQSTVAKKVNETVKHPNQQKLDVHEPEKDELTAKDFEMLRKGKKAKAVKEEEELDEGRGRPRKNPIKPKNDEDDEYGPDTGPEADQNIVNHLKKSVDSEGNHDVKFGDGSSHKVPAHVAHAVLGAMGKLKPADRLEIQKHIHASHKNLMDVHRMIK